MNSWYMYHWYPQHCILYIIKLTQSSQSLGSPRRPVQHSSAWLVNDLEGSGSFSHTVVLVLCPSSRRRFHSASEMPEQTYNVSTVLESEKWWPKLRAMLGTRTNTAYGIRCEAKVAGLNSMQTCVVCVHTSIYRLSCIFEENAQRREREKMTLYYQRP